MRMLPVKPGRGGPALTAVLGLAVILLAAGCVGGAYSMGYNSDGYAAGVSTGQSEDGPGRSGYAPGKSGNGPPPWAPAHGRRAKHSYSYYPTEGVYFNSAQGLYFYLGSNGQWRVSARLPGSITLSGGAVTLEMDSDRPYTYHDDVTKRYPPGKKKDKSGKGKGKSKGKGKPF